MNLDLTEERVRFDFPDATALFKFDEKDRMSPMFHGAPMKGVDVVAEFPKFQLWIEIKEYPSEEIQRMKDEGAIRRNDEPHLKTFLASYFKYKFRDTFLYRFCEGKIDLPIVYVCLTNFDNTLNGFFRKGLLKELPTGKANPTRWKKELIAKDLVFVVDVVAWNRTLASKFGTCERY